MKLRKFSILWNCWPPFLGLGIRIKKISADFKQVTVVLKKRFWNANYFGAQYGGGMFAMTDGVHILMLLQHLPKNYRLWDKSADISYLKRAYSELSAYFEITDEDIAGIKQQVAKSGEITWSREVEIKDKAGQVIAIVNRHISIKEKLP